MLNELMQSLSKNSTAILQNIEILILQNGSTDNTKEILKKYKSIPNIKIVEVEKNIRGSASYKKLVEISQGEFIIFPGDDDIFFENSLDKILPILENSSSKITLFPAGAEVIDRDSDQMKLKYSPQSFSNQSDLLATLFEKSIYWMPATFIRSSAIKNLKSPESLIAFDWYLWILAATKGGVQLISHNVIKYRQHSEKEQNSFLRTNWDIDELFMFIFAIQKGAVHHWIHNATEKELQIFLNELSRNFSKMDPRITSTIKYLLLILEITENSKYSSVVEDFKRDLLHFVDPRFLQAIIGYDLKISDFKIVFKLFDLDFEVNPIKPRTVNGINIYKHLDHFLLSIYLDGEKTVSKFSTEKELIYALLEFYNDIGRVKRGLEITTEITDFERRAIKLIRRIKKFRNGNKFRMFKK